MFNNSKQKLCLSPQSVQALTGETRGVLTRALGRCQCGGAPV